MATPLLQRLKRGLDCAATGIDQWRVKRAPDERTRAEARRHLEARLGRLRGLPQKLGQILSMSTDEQQAASFRDLTGGGPAMPLDEVLALLQSSWGFEPSDVIAEIEPEGLAASLGQVHRAVLRDGREVAIKVQYPQVGQAVEDDLRMLGWLSKPVGDLGRGFDLGAYQRVIAGGLAEELDYRREAEHAEAFARKMGTMAVVPSVQRDLSSEHVLVTSWEDGERIEAVANTWGVEDRAALSRSLLRLFFAQLFEHGLLHADPHSGNYRFRKTRTGEVEVVLYDYGCVREVSEIERLSLLRLIDESSSEGGGDPYPLFLNLGFDAELLGPLRSRLPALCKVLFEAFATPGVFDISKWQLAERVDEVLDTDRWNFRISGAAETIYLMRAFHGLVYYLDQLETPASFSAMLRPTLERLRSASRRVELPVPEDPNTSFAGLAKKLCFQVHEGSVEKARISLPASAIERLDTLIDEELAARIAERGIEVGEIVSSARRAGYAPQELFGYTEGERRVRIWLA